MHAVALTKRSREKDSGTKLTINSCHPGVCNTTLVRMPFYTDYVSKLFAPFVWFLLKTDQDGAQTPLHLALSKKVQIQKAFLFHLYFSVISKVYAMS